MDSFPKTIWFLWYQGEKNMPELISKCYYSWKKKNPDWEVIFLDKTNLNEYLDPKTYNLITETNFSVLASMSDIIRINLLKNHGGVWVDSTTFCNKPLSNWIFSHLSCGFFAFSSPPDKNTLISSWFLAAQKNSDIASVLDKIVYDYWKRNNRMTLWKSNFFIRSVIKRTFILSYFDKNPQRWFSNPIIKLLNLHPYYWFHYLFEKAYIENHTFRSIWDSCPKISSEGPHKLIRIGLNSNITDELITFMETTEIPLFKLNRRIVPKGKYSVLNYLLSNH